MGDLPMPEKTPGRPKKKKLEMNPSASRGAPSGVDQYIASQLKAIYDGVVADPIPDRLLQLIDRLDSDGKN
jgi:Anti-sigma factor NepR